MGIILNKKENKESPSSSSSSEYSQLKEISLMKKGKTYHEFNYKKEIYKLFNIEYNKQPNSWISRKR